MAWISFAIVVLVYCLGLDRFMPSRPFGFYVPFLWVRVNIPYSGYIRLFLWTVGLWLVLYRILTLLERHFGLLEKARLRQGLLYATRPRGVNHIAVTLAIGTLAVTAVKFMLDSARELVVGGVLERVVRSTVMVGASGPDAVLDLMMRSLGSAGLGLWLSDPVGALSATLPFLGSFLRPSLPSPFVPWRIVILCVLTLFAACALGRERRFRYEEDIKEGQKKRKAVLGEMVVPSSGR